MPIMDGLELCKEVRAKYAGPSRNQNQNSPIEFDPYQKKYATAKSAEEKSKWLDEAPILNKLKSFDRCADSLKMIIQKHKSLDLLRQPLIIGTTSLADDITREQADLVGFDAIFEIPLTKENLENIVRMVETHLR